MNAPPAAPEGAEQLADQRAPDGTEEQAIALAVAEETGALPDEDRRAAGGDGGDQVVKLVDDGTVDPGAIVDPSAFTAEQRATMLEVEAAGAAMDAITPTTVLEAGVSELYPPEPEAPAVPEPIAAPAHPLDVAGLHAIADELQGRDGALASRIRACLPG